MNPTDQELVDRAMERADPRYAMSSPALIVELAARLSSLSQSNEGMAAALRPFAKAADGINEMAAEQQRPPHEFSESFGYSHLDKARSAIADLAAPPADSLDAAIKDLGGDWEEIRLKRIGRAEEYETEYIQCSIVNLDGDERYNQARTPLAAFRAALERIPKQEGE